MLDKISGLISLRKQQLVKLDELVKARLVEMFGDPQYNPFQWKSEKLENLCTVSSSKRIFQSEQVSNGVPFLRISDLVNRIDTGVLSCDLYIPEEKYEELKKQGFVPVAGDILITSRGTLGKCYTISDNDRFYFQDGMITWLSKFDGKVASLYIPHLFSMPGFKKQIDNMQSGSTVAYLSIAMAKRLDIMLPSMKLQEQFVAFTHQIDKQKLTIQQSLDKLEVLKKLLMQEYFG